MKEVLDNNYTKGQIRRLQELKQLRKQQKVEEILTTIIGMFIIATTIFILGSL